MNLPALAEVFFLIIASLFFMLKSSFFMLEKKVIVFFLPIFVLGLAYCFQASFFYFGAVTNTISFQAIIAVFAYVFYIFIYYEVNKSGR